MSADQIVAAINDWMFKMRQATPQERTRMIEELVHANNQNVAASAGSSSQETPTDLHQADVGRPFKDINSAQAPAQAP